MFLFENAVAASWNSETKVISIPYRNRISPNSLVPLVPGFTLPLPTKKVGDRNYLKKQPSFSHIHITTMGQLLGYQLL